MALSKIDKIEALLKSIETGDIASVAVVNEAKYVQHNPQTHEGSEGLATLFKKLSKTEPKVNMVRGFEDGDFVFAHMEYDFSSRKICFEVFRFEDNHAVEHWDNLQERQEPNQSGRSMVDGPTEADDLQLTESNRVLIASFVVTALIETELSRFEDFIDAENYVEHNPQRGDDISSFKSELQTRTDGGAFVDYHRLHRVLA